MNCKEIIFSQHAVQRMFERAIQTNTIRSVLESGEVIGDYQTISLFQVAWSLVGLKEDLSTL
jgi:hypothetical protein